MDAVSATEPRSWPPRSLDPRRRHGRRLRAARGRRAGLARDARRPPTRTARSTRPRAAIWPGSRQIPAGLEAKVVDGDLRMWLQVRAERDGGRPRLPRRPVPALLARGRAGQPELVDVLPQPGPGRAVPTDLTAADAAELAPVSGGHDYEWHDGRLHALATIALAPGGHVRRPLDGPGPRRRRACRDRRRALATPTTRRSSGSGRSWSRSPACWRDCACAAAELDLRIARGLAISGADRDRRSPPPACSCTAGRRLRRPAVVLAVMLAFVGWGVSGAWCAAATDGSVLPDRPRGAVGGASLIGMLLHGFVLIALPRVRDRAPGGRGLSGGGRGPAPAGVPPGRASDPDRSRAAPRPRSAGERGGVSEEPA